MEGYMRNRQILQGSSESGPFCQFVNSLAVADVLQSGIEIDDIHWLATSRCLSLAFTTGHLLG